MDWTFNTQRVGNQAKMHAAGKFVSAERPAHNQGMTLGPRNARPVDALAIEAGRRLRAARHEMGWTLQELAELTGVSQSAISNYEQGTRRFGVEVAEAFAKVFNVPAGYWLTLLSLTEARVVSSLRTTTDGITGHHSRSAIDEAFAAMRDRESRRRGDVEESG